MSLPTNPTKVTPLPFPQFPILMIVRFIEPISFTILFPFVYFMVKDFGVTDDEKMIGSYAGMISSAFAVAEFFSGIPWGMLSDKIGRKPVIMIGLLGTMISMFLFGLSKSMTWAIVSRFMCGALNGNIGVIKSMVGEMTDRTNRGFGYTTFMFGMGFIIGPMIGGLLSNPATKFPALFGGIEFFETYPYFLPCGISSAVCLVGFIFAWIYLEETLGKNDIQPKEVESLIKANSAEVNNYGAVSSLNVSTATLVTVASEALTSVSNDTFVESATATQSDVITSATWWVIISYNGLSLMAVILDELFPFWAATSIADGGLSFDSFDIGIAMSFLGVTVVITQLWIYPALHLRFGTLTLYSKVFLLYTPIVVLMPLSSIFARYEMKVPLYLALGLTLGLRSSCNVIAFTSYNIIVPESCPNKRILGKVNGIAQATGSLMRGIGPTLCGVLYSWSLKNGLGYPFDYNLTFWVAALFSLVTYILIRKINPDSVLH